MLSSSFRYILTKTGLHVSEFKFQTVWKGKASALIPMKDSGQVYHESNHDYCCPICFLPITETKNNCQPGGDRVKFVFSRTCGHVFCLACIQKLLLVPIPSKRTIGSITYIAEENTTPPVVPVVTATQGQCPMCRSDLSYFDLYSCFHDGKSIVRTDFPSVVSDAFPDNLFDAVFERGKREDGNFIGFSFPSTMDGNWQCGNTDFIFRYSTDEEDISSISVYPLVGHRYLSLTHTLSLIGNGKMFQGKTPINVDFCAYLTFSDDFQFITHGVVSFTEWQKPDVSSIAIKPKMKGFLQFTLGGNDILTPMRHGGTSSNFPRTPSYNHLSLWGNVFCQDLTIGMASYHFLPITCEDFSSPTFGEAFISYEHRCVSQWPPLDNGRPIPSRVKFHNINFRDPYTFCASICWLQDYNTTWHGACRWDYEMKFDTAYMCIISGKVHIIVTTHDDDSLETANEITARHEVVTFGTELRYINAGLFDEFRKPVLNSEAPVDAPPPSNSVLERLREEGASNAVTSFVRLVQESASEDRDNPIDLQFSYC